MNFKNKLVALSIKNRIRPHKSLKGKQIQLDEAPYNGKYWLWHDLWPSQFLPPSYCNGQCAALTPSAVEKIYAEAKQTNRNDFRLEDFYYVGILRLVFILVHHLCRVVICLLIGWWHKLERKPWKDTKQVFQSRNPSHIITMVLFNQFAVTMVGQQVTKSFKKLLIDIKRIQNRFLHHRNPSSYIRLQVVIYNNQAVEFNHFISKFFKINS